MNSMRLPQQKKSTSAKHNGGFTILISIIVAAVVLAIGLSILSLTLKQVTLAGIAVQSEVGFQIANAGLECVRFHDVSTANGNSFDVPGNGTQRSAASISCFGSSDSDELGSAGSGDEQRFRWTVGGDSCALISVYKFYSDSGTEDVIVNGETVRGDCPEDVECTVVKARGYNRACSLITSEGTVERELTAVY